MPEAGTRFPAGERQDPANTKGMEMADEGAPASIDWGWLRQSALDAGCALVFARDITQDEMFWGFDLDPSSARVENWVFDPWLRRVRVGRACGWTFAIDESMVSLDLALRARNVGGRLSPGTEAVVLSWTPKPTEDFEYWADGVLVTSFEPYRASDRFGSEPDRFLDEMRLVGLVAGADDEEDDLESDLVAALNLATFALGIWLPEQVAMGPLATVTLATGDTTGPGESRSS
jgi:hypothetical protein